MNNKRNGLYLAAFLLCLNLSMEAHGVANNKKVATLDDVMTTLRHKNGNAVSVSSTQISQKAQDAGEKKKVVGKHPKLAVFCGCSIVATFAQKRCLH
ncbi:hypothetical protein J5A56_06685 [Prevotella melaninogenica]|uniref:hypothetical protein n=2 Tax=Prevotella TaxID=838 RepID=UPI001BAE1442|nr:hypothetical protein [Prevotella melaninogenica]QUB74148.1 hypothetical protein J5A56_06685 [Prevotella melaninogenica]